MSALKEVQVESLIAELIAMKDGESVYIKVGSEFIRRLEIAAMKQLALENLFSSCITRDQSEVKEDQLRSVIDEYAGVVNEFMRMLHSVLLQTAGENAYMHITHPQSKLNFTANYQAECIVIFRQEGCSGGSCNCH